MMEMRAAGGTRAPLMLDWLMWLSMPKVNAEWEKPGGGTDNLESWMESEFNYRESRAAVYNITFEIFLFFFFFLKECNLQQIQLHAKQYLLCKTYLTLAGICKPGN